MCGMLIGLNVDLRQTDGMLGYGKVSEGRGRTALAVAVYSSSSVVLADKFR